MKKIPYSNILDAVAGDQIPADLDLAPNIIARIQKGKGYRMQPRLKLISAVLVAAIVLAVLFYAVPGVAAAIGRWFGYLPGVGLVSEGQVRALAEPATLTRAGVTVTVDQVVLNQERTALLYSVDGLPDSAIADVREEPACDYRVTLRLPDGSQLLATPNGVQNWGSGYQHRFNYAPVPGAVDAATLLIPCLYQARPGAAPENWEIPLRFVAAAPGATVFPVIEIPTPTAVVAGAAVTDTPVAGTPATAAPADAEAGLSLTLDRAVQMEDGYLLYATLHWEAAPYSSVSLNNPAAALHLLDANGQELVYELRDEEGAGVNVDQRQTVFALKTAPVQTPGPLTLALDSVMVTIPAEASFVFDPGPDPRQGQEWQPGLEISIGERRLRVVSVVHEGSGYSVAMNSDTGIISAGVVDHEHTVVSGFCTEGSLLQGGRSDFGCGWNYQDGVPAGPLTLSITSISVEHAQPLAVQWTPPAVSATLLPADASACLTPETWQAALGQPRPIPAGLAGKVLVRGPVDENNPAGDWGIAIANLDGSARQPIAGANDGAFSPDGAKLAYSKIDSGIWIMDLSTGQSAPLAGTGYGDFNPLWSPDGERIVFNRGVGIFDLFIVNLDGSELRQLTSGGVQEYPAGWLADGSLLYNVAGRVYETTVYRLDLHSGESQVFSNENISSVSPDGQQLAISELAFGERWQVAVSDLTGANRRALASGSLWVLTPRWSADGQWLLAGVSDTDSGATLGALFNPSTCEVIPVPGLRGSILSWAQ